MYSLSASDCAVRRSARRARRQLLKARRAWSAGGPIPHGLLGTDWQPVPTTDFLLLVPRALDGDANARYTLQVAGGIALVADRLLAGDTGSAIQFRTVPFRADPSQGRGRAGRTGQPGRAVPAGPRGPGLPVGQGSGQLLHRQGPRERQQAPPRGGLHRAEVDPTGPTQILLDATGQPVPLIQFDVVQMSIPERAAKAIADAEAEATTGFTVPKGASEKAQLLRGQLETGLKAIQHLITELEAISQAGDPAVGPPLGTRDDWARVSVVGNKVSLWITMNEPPEASSATDEAAPRATSRRPGKTRTTRMTTRARTDL